MQNLDKSKFEQTFAELPAKRMKVLRMLLAGNTDTAIAQSLNIEAGTVRTQIAQICKAFGLSDSSGERRSRRADLLTLFAKYKPELVGKKSKPFDSELKVEETATKVISNSDSDRTGEDSHSPTPHSPRPEDSQARFTLVLSGTVSEVDRARAEAIIAHLKNVVGDVEMTLEEIKSGSILLVCRSSPEDAELVKWMFKSGQLAELCGFPVLDVRLETVSEVASKAAIAPNSVNFSQWFQNVVEAGVWQTIEEIFGTQPSLGFRSAVDRDIVEKVKLGKLIDLGIPPASYPIALFVSITPESHEKFGISLQVFPAGEQKYLPPSLQLIVLDESAEVFMEAKSRENDNWIQLELRGEPGDHFSVKVALENTSLTENFLI